MVYKKHVAYTHSVVVCYPSEQIFPLFEMTRQQDWLDSWQLHIVYSESGKTARGGVFRSTAMDEMEAISIVTRFEPENFCLEYVKVRPASRIGIFAIQCTPVNNKETRLTVSINLTALTEHGLQHLHEYSKERFCHETEWWATALGYYLETGKKLDRPENRFFKTDEQIKQLIKEFEAGTLTLERFSRHHNHLAMTMWYLTKYERTEAVNRVKSGLKQYIAAQNIEGYNETQTMFWLQVFFSFLKDVNTSLPIVDLTNMMIARYSNSKFIFQYYSRERLMSAEARLTVMEPDLKPFDF